jgi:hypothetical protein
MVEIRPIWRLQAGAPAAPDGPVTRLLEIEKTTIDAFELCSSLAPVYLGESQARGTAFLNQSAKVDLVAGCELARCGYLKQAYALWRSWFEQSLFSLYFLEAPLHKAAWKVNAEVTLEDNPQYRLMLHQLLAESGERHAFAIVYNDRFTRVMETLKVSNNQIPKGQRPIARATKILTMLSQGVHGTYQPAPAASADEAGAQLGRHCLPILQGAADSILLFWLLLLTSYVDIPPEVLIKLREGSIEPAVVEETGLEEADKIAQLAPVFKRAFATA